MDDAQALRGAVEDLKKQLYHETMRVRELEQRCVLLEKLATYDPATGLRTEASFHARVREEVERATRYPSAVALLTICVPDERAGAILRLGQRLMGELRCTDHVFKLADTDLAVLLVETGTDGAHRVMERMTDELEQFIRGFGYSVTSFPADANLAEDFLRLALDRHREVARQVRPENSPATSTAEGC